MDSNYIQNVVYEPLAVAQMRRQTLKNAIMNTAHTAVMNPQIEQAGALGLQQQQIGMEDQRKIGELRQAAAAALPAGGGPVPSSGLMDGNFINRAAAAGVSAGGLNTLTQNYLKQLETKSIADKNAAESTHYAEQTKQIKMQVAGSAANAVLQLPPEQRPAGWARHRDSLITNGYASADQIPEAYPGDVALQQISDSAVKANELQAMKIAANEESRKAALAPFQLREAGTKAAAGELGLAGQTLGAATNQDQWTAARAALPAAQQANVPVMFSQQAAADARRVGMSAGEQTTADQQKAALEQTRIRDAQTKANEEATRHQRDVQIGIEGGRLKLEQQRFGFDQAGGISDAARMAVDGRMNPQTLQRLLRSQPGLLGQIRQLDPNFDEANLDNRYNTLKEFTNTSLSKAGGQSIALSTLIHHADLYMQAAEALHNHTFVPGNAAYNTIATTFGQAPPQNAALLARFLAGETGKVATGGIPAEGEVNGILKNLSTSGSEDQLMNAGRTIIQIAGGKAVPLMERAHKAKIDGVVDVLGPHAQEILKRRGFNPATMQPDTPAAGGATPAKNPYRSDR